ncbi:siderophore-interacting protein [Vibrio sp. WXL210]|uniref:siderophore-interacting protein n=1 Tax=Vibrio sp. WXL210 TaxID=3450709 RepID=UPI003EC6A078
MKKKPTLKRATVVSTQTITPNMQRLVLQSDDFAKFPHDCGGDYVKLVFTPDGNTDLTTLDDASRPVMRTYTIRQFDSQTNTIEIDFVRHITQDPSCGFAARWAMHASVNDTISIAGPGAIAPIKLDASWFFMVADMTSLPALTAKTKSLPDHAQGYAVIQVASKEDIQALALPESMQVIWVTGEDLIEERVRELEWLSDDVFVWCACEFDTMRAMRQYFRNEKNVDREAIYISSYWKRGVTEDGHKVLKKQDAEQESS